MISSDVLKFCESLVNCDDGYDYYLIYSNNDWNTSYYGQTVAAYVVRSKDPITAQGRYSYSCSGDYVMYSVISANASERYHNERVTVTTGSDRVFNIDEWEYVYTNAEWEGASLQPDLKADNGVSHADFTAVSIILCVVLFTTLLLRILRWGS